MVVSVKDTGIGIPAEQLPPASRCSRRWIGALERSQGGLGIGLTLVRLVEMHGGSVEARSDGLGKGASSSSACRSSWRRRPRPGDGEKAARQPCCPHRILIVDDNKTRPIAWRCCCGSWATTPARPTTDWKP